MRFKVALIPVVILLAALACLAGLAAGGCIDSYCDPGQTHQDGLCYPGLDAQPPSIDGGAADGGPTDGSADDGGSADATADPFAHYGDVCADTDGCEAPADYCAVQPGQPTGFCTHTGCLEDDGVCPAGWGCLDLSVFDPTLPSICTQP